jgi:FkbM family methyltransferase
MPFLSARAKERARSLAMRAGVEPQLVSVYHLIDRTARREALDNAHMKVVLAATLRPDSNCIDVGAHTGGILQEIVRCAPEGRHIAYEPLPDLAAALARNYPQVEVRNAALSDHAGEASFLRDPNQLARSTLHAHAFTDREHAVAFPVRLEKLDDALPEGYVPAVIKIDVEGAEADVLTGALETLKRHKPIVVFEHGAGGVSDPANVYSLVAEHAGLRVFDLDGSGPYSLSEFVATYPLPTMWNWIARP